MKARCHRDVPAHRHHGDPSLDSLLSIQDGTVLPDDGQSTVDFLVPQDPDSVNDNGPDSNSDPLASTSLGASSSGF